MDVSLANIRTGASYSRKELAAQWGCASFHALARGVVTPRNDNKIILFVTERKQKGAEPYEDSLLGDTLRWEGPNDHFAEDRLVNASRTGEEIHLFHRDRHHSDFVYWGRLTLVECHRFRDRPSRFMFRLAEGMAD